MLDFREIPLTVITPSPFQVRRHMDPAGIQEFARSVERDALIEPIVVRRVGDTYEIIAGERRWRAKQLVPGATTILARVVEATDVQARRMLVAENVQREDLSLLEWIEAIVEIVDAELSEDPTFVAYGDTSLVRVRTLLTKLDSDRRRGTDHVSHTFMGQVESLFGQLPKRLEWRSFLENDLPLLTKLGADVQAVAIMEKLNKDQMKALGELQQHAPEKFHEVVTQKGVKPRQDLGDTRAHPDELRPLNDVSARELRQLASHEAIRLARQQHPVIETPAWPEGKFRCVVIDPPWPVKKSERTARPYQGNTLDYPTMTLEEIAALPIADLADPEGCHVYLWVPQRFVLDGGRLFEAWGVHYHCQLTWVKPTGMTPFSWQFNAEHVLFGWIGHLPILEKGHKITFEAPSIEHSTKPEVFYERVRAVSPGPRLELFARKPREGFQVWGHEVRMVSDELA